MVAVVVPCYKAHFSHDERLALAHLRRFLGGYPIYFAVPEALELDLEAVGYKRYPNHFFCSVASYSRLLLTPSFYQAFSAYEYVLIYQLDCLIFSDQLEAWCAKGYDYMGAPWLKAKGDPSKGFSRVGNGGLSLRKVESFLKVLGSERYVDEPVAYWKEVCHTSLKDVAELPVMQRFLKRLRVLRDVRKGVSWYTAHYTLNEDHFWSDRARLFYPEFKIAPVEEALGFAFEQAPAYCFERNNRQLPFGCHAWAKWDRAFWEPYLLES